MQRRGVLQNDLKANNWHRLKIPKENWKPVVMDFGKRRFIGRYQTSDDFVGVRPGIVQEKESSYCD